MPLNVAVCAFGQTRRSASLPTATTKGQGRQADVVSADSSETPRPWTLPAVGQANSAHPSLTVSGGRPVALIIVGSVQSDVTENDREARISRCHCTAAPATASRLCHNSHAASLSDSPKAVAVKVGQVVGPRAAARGLACSRTWRRREWFVSKHVGTQRDSARRPARSACPCSRAYP